MDHQSQLMQRVFLSPYFLLGAALVSFFLGLGSVPLFDLDEGAFTEATREMLSSGVYSATFLDGEPRYDKPILFYWFQAASIKLFGFNEWAFRLPSALAACLWACAIFSFVKEFASRERAQIASLFMLSCLWVAVIGRSAVADSLLNLFLSLALFDIWRHLQKGTESSILRAYMWMALGSLTKGPVAVIVPLAVSFLYLVSAKQLKLKYLAYFNYKGWAVYLIIVTPWLIAVWFTQGMGFFEGFLGDHNLSRFTETKENHGGSIFYYFAALPLILLPISGLLIPAISNYKMIWGTPLYRFLFIWFAVIFCLFSFSKTQLPHYILNCCVALFILLACVPNVESKNRWTCLIPLTLLAALVFLPELLAKAASDSAGYDGALLALHAESIPAYYRWFAGAAFIGALTLCIVPQMHTWQRLSGIGLILIALVATQIVKTASNLQQKQIHVAIAFLNTHYPNEKVVAYRMHMPSFSVYRQTITPLRTPEAGELALVRVDRYTKLQDKVAPRNTNILHRYGGLMIIQVENDHE